MRFFTVFLSVVLSFNTYASLITTQNDQVSYNAGDPVVVEFFANNANPMIDWLDIEYSFDDSLLSFDSFMLDNDVFLNSEFDDSYALFGALFLTVDFVPDWSDFLTTSFKLGEVRFTALADSVDGALQLESIFAADENFVGISQDKLQVSVPEPESLAFIPVLACMLLLNRRQKQSLK